MSCERDEPYPVHVALVVLEATTPREVIRLAVKPWLLLLMGSKQ